MAAIKKLSLESKAQTRYIVVSFAVDNACKFNQLIIPWADQLLDFIQWRILLVSTLQYPVFLFEDSRVVGNRLQVGGLDRRDSTIKKSPARFRCAAHDFEIWRRERENRQLCQVTC